MNNINLSQIQVRYIEAQNVIADFESKYHQLDFNYKNKFAIEHPDLLMSYETMKEFVEWCQDLGIHKTIRKAD